jgi:hypothetical protein
MKDCPELQEKLAASHGDGGDNREPLFPEHWAPAKIISDIKAGKIFQGTFYASRFACYFI